MDARTPIEGDNRTVVLSVAFNDTCSHFAVATTTGYKVFSSATCTQEAASLTRHGIGFVEMRGRSNILALVGGGRIPLSSPTKVLIYDQRRGHVEGEISCPFPVRGVRLANSRVVVLLQREVRVYNLSKPPQLLHSYPTADNIYGLCAVSRKTLAFPGRSGGHVQLVAQHERDTVSIIPAHASALRAIALSRDGELLATASEKGTLIRVWATATSARLAELRRGFDPATIFSLAFSPSAAMLACTSDKGTLHIYDVPRTSSSSAAAAASPSSAAATAATQYQPQQQQQQPQLPRAAKPVDPPDHGQWCEVEVGASNDSDVASFYNQPPPGSSAGAGGGAVGPSSSSADATKGKWGILGKIPFMPRYFSDTVSFASVEFAMGEELSGPDRAREEQLARPLGWPRLPRGVVGWTAEDTVVVVGAGADAKYERFVVAATTSGGGGAGQQQQDGAAPPRTCVRKAWAAYGRRD